MSRNNCLARITRMGSISLWHFRPPNFSFCKPLRQCCRYALFSDSVQTTELPAQTNQLFSDSVCVYDNSWITHIVQLWWEPGRYLDNYGCIWMMFVWTTPTLYVSNFCTNTHENERTKTSKPGHHGSILWENPPQKLCPFKKSKLPIVQAQNAVLWNWVISREHWV